MMNIAIYTRKSKETIHGESIGNQIELCMKYIKANINNTERIYKYEDEGFSGKNIDRPRFKQLMKDAKNNKFDILICYRLDRISRSVCDFSEILETLTNYKINFVSIKEQFDTSSPMGRAMMYIASVFAQLERETIAERVRDNMIELSKTGRWLGGHVPLGFNTKRVVEEGKEVTYLEPNTDIKIAETIYKKYLNTHSLYKTNKYLLENNIKNRNWTTSIIGNILRSPYYVKCDEKLVNYLKKEKITYYGEINGNGLLPYNVFNDKRNRKPKIEWIYAIGKHKGIIDSDEWIQIQDLLDANRSLKNTGNSFKGLLSGLLRCGKCGRIMNISYGAKRKDGSRPYYYRCNGKIQGGITMCDMDNIRTTVIDTKVIDKLKNTDFYKSAMNITIDEKDVNKDIEFVKKQINKNKKDIDKLLQKMILLDANASVYVTDKINELANENKILQQKLYDLELEKEDVSINNINTEICKSAYKKFINTYEGLDAKQQQRLIKEFVREIKWNGKNKNIEISLL